MKLLFLLPSSLCLLLFFSGCETTTAGGGKSKAKKEQIYLAKGMTGDEVKSLLGEPLSVKKSEEPGSDFETWIYEESQERSIPVQADTREVPYTNPVTRETTTITEAVTKIKTERTTLTTELFMSQGKLIGWNTSTKEDSWYQN